MPTRAVSAQKPAQKAVHTTMSLAAAKAHFSEVVAAVEQRRHPVTILRRGQPVAQITPLPQTQPALYGSMRGTVIELGDIVGPTGEDWELAE